MNASPGLPCDATAAYERVRADVVAGRGRPEALGAVIFHGMWQGLRVLLSTCAATSPTVIVSSPSAAAPTGTHDRQLVRLLADMVLATQLEVHHAQ